MVTVAIINQKGGTGKTTTTINLGSGLAKKKKKVLLIDLDAQGNLTYALGVQDYQVSMADVMVGEAELNDVLVESGGMAVAPSDNRLADAELTLLEQSNREQNLKNALKDAKGFDFVLIDCPPSLSVLTLNALMAADKIVIPMQMEVLTLQGLDQILSTVNEVKSTFGHEIAVSGILPVMFNQRRKLSQEIKEYILANYDVNIFDTFIRTNVSASEAPSFGQSVIDYQPNSNSAQDYLSFTKEFLKSK